MNLAQRNKMWENQPSLEQKQDYSKMPYCKKNKKKDGHPHRMRGLRG
jgi:hypothetical protein